MLFKIKAVEEPFLIACLLAHHADVPSSFLLPLGQRPRHSVQESFSTELAKSGHSPTTECFTKWKKGCVAAALARLIDVWSGLLRGGRERRQFADVAPVVLDDRSEERRVGKECCALCR